MAVIDAREFLIVPHGVEHCPAPDGKVHMLLLEPAATLNTGTAGGAPPRS